MQYVTFYVGMKRYGVPILVVREIIRPHTITPVHGADGCVEGLMNLRGNIIIVLNLRGYLMRFKIQDSKEGRGDDSWIVVLRTERELSPEAVEKGLPTLNDNIGLLVDGIGDVVDVEDDEVEPPPVHISQGYISGVIKLEGELLTLLSTEWPGNLEEKRTHLARRVQLPPSPS